jgi:hypothetical protein
VTYEVKVWIEGNTQPIVYQALAVYQQRAYTCIAYVDKNGNKRVRKFPTDHIWAIDEEYKYVEYKPTAQEKKSEDSKCC